MDREGISKPNPFKDLCHYLGRERLPVLTDRYDEHVKVSTPFISNARIFTSIWLAERSRVKRLNVCQKELQLLRPF